MPQDTVFVSGGLNADVLPRRADRKVRDRWRHMTVPKGPQPGLAPSRENAIQDDVLLQGLLGTVVYVHAPLSDESEHVRLIQFRHPDGFDVIPFFSSLGAAERSRLRGIEILSLSGRSLMESTRGATLMLDPNDGGPLLYPEDITALLNTGTVFRVQKMDAPTSQVRPAQDVPTWLVPTLRTTLQRIEFVDAAYLLDRLDCNAADEPPGLLIWLVGDVVFAERAARWVGAALQPRCIGLERAIDIAFHDRATPLPSELEGFELQPAFKRM